MQKSRIASVISLIPSLAVSVAVMAAAGLTEQGMAELASLWAGLVRLEGPMSSLSWDLQPRYTCLQGLEDRVDLEELVNELLVDVVVEDKVLNLLLYLWLGR